MQTDDVVEMKAEKELFSEGALKYAVIPSLLAITGTAVGVAAMKVFGRDYEEVDPHYLAPKVMAGLTAALAAYSYLKPSPEEKSLFGPGRK